MDGFDHYLDFVAPRLPAELIGPAALTAIRHAAAHLPGALAFSTYGFEVPLGRPEPEADFLVSLSRELDGPALLADGGPGSGWDPALLAESRWQDLYAFGAAWAAPDGLLTALDDVWLELDLRERPEGLPLPSLFFDPQRDVRGPHAGLSADVLAASLAAAHRCAAGRPLAPAVAACLDRVLAVGPLRRHLFQVGFMLAREGSGVRLVTTVPSAEDLLESLAACRWPGDVAAARDLAQTAFAFADTVALHLDVGEGVAPVLGLEIVFRQRREPRREPRWTGLLDGLVADGLCTPEKRAGMLAYAGYETSAASGLAFPPSLAAAAAAQGPEVISMWVRKLFHVKLVSRPDRPPEAKGYLSVTHHWHEIDADVLALMPPAVTPGAAPPAGPGSPKPT
jgi:hypothetical protein